MFGLWRNNALKSDRERHRYATLEEVSCYFREHHELLFRMAHAITGKEEEAKECVTSACKGTTGRQSVFLSWVGNWVQFAVVRRAIQAIKDEIAKASETQPCEFCEYSRLSEAEIRVLRAIDPVGMSTDLDPLARSVLLLQSLRNTNVYDCVVVLDVPCAVGGGRVFPGTRVAAHADNARVWCNPLGGPNRIEHGVL
jgi:hypothetical protein